MMVALGEVSWAIVMVGPAGHTVSPQFTPLCPPHTHTAAADFVKRVMTRGRDACAQIGPAADLGCRREVEAFLQLGAVWELLVATRKGRHDQVGGGGGRTGRGSALPGWGGRLD